MAALQVSQVVLCLVLVRCERAVLLHFTVLSMLVLMWEVGLVPMRRGMVLL